MYRFFLSLSRFGFNKIYISTYICSLYRDYYLVNQIGLWLNGVYKGVTFTVKENDVSQKLSFAKKRKALFFLNKVKQSKVLKK
jgi:hypothetical protein